MANKNYSGSLALTKLVHVIMEKKGKNGMVKGLFIPVEQNHLVPGKDNAFYMPIRVITKDEEDKYGQNGFISQSVDSKKYRDASDEEKQKFSELPILGNIKDFSGGSSNDNAGAASNEVLSEDDDLPF